jgi:hypothetical protein
MMTQVGTADSVGGPWHEPTELFAQNESPSWQPTRAVTKKPDLPRKRRRPRKRRSSSAAEGAPDAVTVFDGHGVLATWTMTIEQACTRPRATFWPATMMTPCWTRFVAR